MHVQKLLSKWQLPLLKMAETNSLLTGFCPPPPSKVECDLKEGRGQCREGREQAEPLRLWEGEGFLGEEEALGPGFPCLPWEAGRPAGACLDFETPPRRTEPKPWEGWPPPQQAASLL